MLFFLSGLSFTEYSRIIGTAGEGGDDFQLFHRHLNISRAITAESLPLHIAIGRTRTGTVAFRAQVANH